MKTLIVGAGAPSPFVSRCDMRLTTFTDYGLRTLMYVGAKGEQLSTVDEIARTYGISRHHITKVVHHLGRRGYLCNIRGKRGGIALGRPPSAINVGTLVRELEGDLGLVECYRQKGCCLEPVCLLRKALDEALLAFLSVLSRYTLADLLKPDRQLKSLLQIPVAASRGSH